MESFLDSDFICGGCCWVYNYLSLRWRLYYLQSERDIRLNNYVACLTNVLESMFFRRVGDLLLVCIGYGV